MSQLAEILRSRAEERPEHVAFAHRGQARTYAELMERAAARAAALRQAGVDRGDRVVIALPAGLELIEVFWALQLLGAAPCVINPRIPAPALARRAALVRPKLVISDVSTETIARVRRDFTWSSGGADDVAYLQLTSGSTGEPRASILRNRNILAHLDNIRLSRLVGGDDAFVSWAPPWHDMGLVLFVIAPVYYGATCHLVEPSVWTIPEWLRTITRVAGTVTAAPDFAFRLAARLVDPAEVDLRSLRWLAIGAEPVRWSTVQGFEQRFGVQVSPGYGLGEATLIVSSHLGGEDIGVDARGNVSCGLPDPATEVRAGSSLEEPAEILVRGPQVFSGYLDAPDETERALREGWLHTGDSGYIDGQGRLFVLGRREGMIKRAGAVIAPRELEDAATEVPGVRAAGAVALSRSDRDDQIAVALELDRGGRATDRAGLVAEVSATIGRAVGFECHRISVIRKLPRTDNGKIRYRALQEQLAAATRDAG